MAGTALGHDFSVAGTASNGPSFLKQSFTCTREEQYWNKCQRCGVSANGIDNTKYGVTNNAPGHKWILEIASHLTCTTHYQVKQRCHQTCHDTSIDGAITQNLKTVTAAPGHNFTKLVQDVAPKCTTAGSYHTVCTNVFNYSDGTSYSCTQRNNRYATGTTAVNTTGTTPVAALHHFITDDKISKVPSVYSKGVRSYYCRNCVMVSDPT